MKRVIAGNLATQGIGRTDSSGTNAGQAGDRPRLGVVGQQPGQPWWESGSVRTNKSGGSKAEFEAAAAQKLDWINIEGMTTRLPARRFSGMFEVYRHPQFQ